MIHNYPYTDFHELNLDYLMKLARESMGLHFEQADKFLKLVNAQGQEVSRAKIYYAETALKDDLGNNIDAYIISTSLQGDNIIFTKGNGEYTTVTIPYAVKASKDVNNVDLTSYIHGLSVAGEKLLITYGNGETASITVPYAVKASTDENGKSITTYVAELSTGNNKLIVKDGDGTTIAELTIPYATSALNDVDGDAIKSTYGTDLTPDTTTVQLRSKDGAIISTITVPYATKALSDDQGNNFRSDYGFNLAVDGNKVALEAHDGTTLNEITVPFATLATDATNAIESVSISGDEIVFTTYGGNSYRITSPYAVKALKDNLNNTITTTYVASVTNDPDTGEISFYASDGSLISTLIPTLDSAIHDSYGNLIGDFVKEIIVNPQNNYVVVNHGTGDSDTITINYATHAYKDTYENVIGNTYIRSLSIITDTSDNKKYLVAYNGELSELFRLDITPRNRKRYLVNVVTQNLTAFQLLSGNFLASNFTRGDVVNLDTGEIVTFTTMTELYNEADLFVYVRGQLYSQYMPVIPVYVSALHSYVFTFSQYDKDFYCSGSINNDGSISMNYFFRTYDIMEFNSVLTMPTDGSSVIGISDYKRIFIANKGIVPSINYFVSVTVSEMYQPTNWYILDDIGQVVGNIKDFLQNNAYDTNKVYTAVYEYNIPALGKVTLKQGFKNATGINVVLSGDWIINIT